jgi:hypothetical protein
MIANPRFHRWSDTQGLMNSAKIVVHVMERNRVLQILQFLRECVCEPGKSAHRHSQRQILPFNVARGNVIVIGSAADNRFASAHADCRTVARFRRFQSSAVYLLQHRVLDLRAKRIFNGCQISAVPIAGKLDSICKAVFQIMYEVIRAASVTLSDEPAGNEFRIRIKRDPCPNIPRAIRFMFRRAIFFFRVNETPNFVALDSLRRKIAKRSAQRKGFPPLLRGEVAGRFW